MTDNDAICNYKKCRKRLTTFAWVTSCSHIFCDEDGTNEFNKSYTCPACEANLSGKFDIVRIDLQPSDQYKSMVLAGQRPDTIMEICSRAIAFWNYQVHQERVYYEYIANKAKEGRNQIEHFYEQLSNKFQSESAAIKAEISAKTKEIGELKKRLTQLSEKHLEKCRQNQKLQSMYDSLRRRSINPAAFEERPAMLCSSNPTKIRDGFQMQLGTDEGAVRQKITERGKSIFKGHHQPSPEQNEFVLRPVPTPDLSNCSAADLPTHRVADVQSKFSLMLSTPALAKRDLK